MPTYTDPISATRYPSATHAALDADAATSHRDAVTRLLGDLARQQPAPALRAALMEIAEGYAFLDRIADTVNSARTYCERNAAACRTTADDYAPRAVVLAADLAAELATLPADLAERVSFAADTLRYYEREGARLDGMRRGYLDAVRVFTAD